MKWFRLHNKLLNDPSVQRLSGDHFKMYINMLCLASSEDKGGYIGTIDDVSFALRCVSSDVSSCFIALQESDLLVTQTVASETDSETLHETFHINKWAKNQYESDSSTKRVKKFREKEKRSKGVTKTVTVTPPDTDTDTEQIQTQNRADTDKNKQKDLSPAAPAKWNKKRFADELIKLGADSSHVSDWMTTRKTFTETAFKSTIKHINKTDKTVAEIVEICAGKGWVGFDVKYMDGLQQNKGPGILTNTKEMSDWLNEPIDGQVINQQGFIEHGS